jgi:hypothetical protein
MELDNFVPMWNFSELDVDIVAIKESDSCANVEPWAINIPLYYNFNTEVDIVDEALLDDYGSKSSYPTQLGVDKQIPMYFSLPYYKVLIDFNLKFSTMLQL